MYSRLLCPTHSPESSSILWPVDKVVKYPGCEVLVHPCELQPVPQKCRLNGVESTGEIKEHDPHSASRLLQVRQLSFQKEDDGVVHIDASLIGKLEWVHKRSHHSVKMDEDQLQSLRCEVSTTGL